MALDVVTVNCIVMKNLLLNIAILFSPIFALTMLVLGFYLEQPTLSCMAVLVLCYIVYLKKYNKNFRLRL